MAKFKEFALNRPFLFGILLIIIYSILGTLTFPVHFLFAETEVGQLYGDAVSKLVIFLFFFLILWRFDWIKHSGFTRVGKISTWSVVLVIAVYKISAELYAFTGDPSIKMTGSPLSIANLLYFLPASLVEETMYRALVLIAMITAWGNTKRGQVNAVLLSSLFFGLIHLFNLIVRSWDIVIFQSLVVVLPGLLYAALVLKTRSLWPAILIHWLSNAAVNIRIIGILNYQESFSMWITFAISLLPLMAYSAFIIWKLPIAYRYIVDDPT